MYIRCNEHRSILRSKSSPELQRFQKCCKDRKDWYGQDTMEGAQGHHRRETNVGEKDVEKNKG